MMPDPSPEPAPGPRLGSPLPLHLLPDNATVASDGSLNVAGVDVVELAREMGTPLFVYDEDHLRTRCRQAVEAWPDGVAYASKAFLCKAMARLAHEEGCTIDVSTAGEMHTCLAAGVPAERLVLHGNNKSDYELERALLQGVGRIVVDSFDEIDRLGRLVATTGTTPRVLLRVNPGVEAHTHEYVMTGQTDSKFGFGISSGAAAEAAAILAKRGNGMELVGLHAHIGSQIFALESFSKELGAMAELFKGLDLEELCVGGGLGVAYVEGEISPTFADWASTARQAAAAAGISAHVKLTAEAGRSIAASAALTLYSVGTIKVLPGVRTYVSVDGGMSDNPRPVLYGSGYEAFLPRAVTAARSSVVTIVGKHCESGDVLVRDACVPADMVVGDVLATPVTGAYGHSMASNYNKVPRPAVVFVREASYRVVVRRETLDDLVALDL